MCLISIICIHMIGFASENRCLDIGPGAQRCLLSPFTNSSVMILLVIQISLIYMFYEYQTVKGPGVHLIVAQIGPIGPLYKIV